MVSLLVHSSHGLSSPGTSPGRRHSIVLCSWARHFTLSHSASLNSGVQMGTETNLMLGVTLQWISIPSRGSINTPNCFILRKPG